MPLGSGAAKRLDKIGHAGSEGGGVIDTFNASRSLAEVLNAHGYKGGPFGPWLYPHSSSGQAGVRLRPERTSSGAQVVMSWHASDPLGDGLPRDAFAVWAVLEHGLDPYTANREQLAFLVKDAARLLGLPEPQRSSAASSKNAAPNTAQTEAPDWGEVSALPPMTEKVPTLTPDLLPPSLAAWVQDEARAAGLPLEMIAAPVIAGAAGLIGARLLLRNAPNAPAVPANIWAAVCAPPASKKTHAVKTGAAALERAQRTEFERLDRIRSELETQVNKARARLDGLEGQLSRAFKGGKNAPSAPSDDELTEAREQLKEAEAALKPLRFVVKDSTIEKLGDIMKDNPQGVTLVIDELTGWLASFEKAGHETDRAFFLTAANGTNSHTVDRKGGGTTFIPRLCAGVIGGIQPAPLSKMLSEQLGAGDGLLQRFQVFIWPDVFPDFDQTEQRRPLDLAQKEAAAAVLDALPSLTLEALGSVYPSGDGAPLTYSAEAQRVYDAWEIEHASAVRDESKGEAYRAHLGKQPATFAQLALTFHALEVATLGGSHPDPLHVSGPCAALAAAWCDYLTPHAAKLWGEGRRRDVFDAKEVLRFIERGRIRDGQKVSEARAVLAEGKAGMTEARLTAALKVLEECGAAKVEKVKPHTGRPSLVLRLHPDALRAGEGGV